MRKRTPLALPPELECSFAIICYLTRPPPKSQRLVLFFQCPDGHKNDSCRRGRKERPVQKRARCQSPLQVGFRDTHTDMYYAPPISRGIKNTLTESRELERWCDGKRGKGGKSRRANGTKGMCKEIGLCDAKVEKRIQRAQSRFTESHYLPQITWATSVK